MDERLLNERRWGVAQVRFLPKAPTRKLLYFVRHAESNWNAAQSSMNGTLHLIVIIVIIVPIVIIVIIVIRISSSVVISCEA